MNNTTIDDVLAAADNYSRCLDDQTKAKLRWDLENKITDYAATWANEQVKTRDKALEAARLLCANLRNGGVGHKTLIEAFDKADSEVE